MDHFFMGCATPKIWLNLLPVRSNFFYLEHFVLIYVKIIWKHNFQFIQWWINKCGSGHRKLRLCVVARVVLRPMSQIFLVSAKRILMPKWYCHIGTQGCCQIIQKIETLAQLDLTPTLPRHLGALGTFWKISEGGALLTLFGTLETSYKRCH